jgi:hypothetical protein
VRVTLKRGLLRDVCAGDSPSRVRWLGSGGGGGGGRAVDSLLDEPEVSEPEVPELVVGGPGGPLISVVEIFGVLVTVWVVVVAAADSDAVAEKDGSTKFSGASVGSSPPLTYITAATRTAMMTTPMALAPSSARVELCQGSDGSSPSNSSTDSSSPNSSSRSGLATTTDINLRTCANAASSELGDHLGGEQLEVVEIGHIQ